MKKMLVITTSLNGAEGNSTKLAQQFVAQLQDKVQDNAQDNVQWQVTELDLNKAALPHLGSEEIQAWSTSPSERTEVQQAFASISDNYVEQLKAADVIVLGVPMYNFGIPSALKAWIDRVARAGVTFQYTENGPEGLLKNKSVYILAARGGMYAGTALDTQTNYLKDVFNFIGLDNIHFVYAEGLAMGEGNAQKAWQKSNEKIIELIPNVGA